MEKWVCRQCEHFHQHYVLNQYRATPVDCGHCDYPRLKKRKAGNPVCGSFARREGALDLPQRAEVLNYLTVDLLEYILTLKLPPEVLEGDGRQE